MMELIHAAFSPVNVVFTVLLILTVIYWLTVILGVLDAELFDFNFDSGLEVDADLDVDADGEVDVDGVELGALRSVLHFFYIGEVPVMILLSIMILSMWALCMLGNYYLNPKSSVLIAVPIAGVNLVISLFICKVFAMPLKKIYDVFNTDYNTPRKVIGRICIITTTKVSKKMGQAEVKTKGAPIVLNVVSEGGHVFHKGDEAVIIGKDDEKGIYTIAPVNLEK
ncbi:MAG: hypothetical protein ACYTBP_01710 [Planctomycetota bacterium]|jgi:hypothetical protein